MKIFRWMVVVWLAIFWVMPIYAATDCSLVTSIPQKECEVLLDLYNSTNGPQWAKQTNWNVTNTPCSCTWTDVNTSCAPSLWTGLGCSCLEEQETVDENGNTQQVCVKFTVTGIFLPFHQLTGPIPKSLGNLTNLKELSLGDNQLTGPIPESLGKLTNLESLWLGGNQLTGPIPDLSKLTKLQDLYLYDNQLAGTIPESLGNLTNLKWLNLGDNQLTGTIPESLGDLTNLKFLNLSFNQLTGPIPESLGKLTKLEWLDLFSNQLTGTIPEFIGKLNSLEILHLRGNQLTDVVIPQFISNLTNLRHLSLGNQQLTGTIPEFFGKLINLETLSLGDQLSGTIPESLGNLTKLEALFLGGNQLTGTIPNSLTKLINLTFLDLVGNCLVASEPTLIAFLNEKNPYWLSTRICPVDITVTGKGVVEFPPPDCSFCPECSWCTDTLNCDSNTNVDNKDLDCTITYPVGEKTILAVKPAENWIFSDWQGNCDSGGTITVTPTGVQCHATFKELVDVDVTIVGEGIVEFDPLPSKCSLCTVTLACDSSTRADNTDFICTAKYPVGDKVTMIAKPAKDWKFIGWQGNCDSAGILTVANDTSCQATFHSGFMDIGNLRVYADSFTNMKAEPRVYTASGNVTLAKIGGNKILSVNGALKLDFRTLGTSRIDSVGQVSVTALDIRPNPKDMPRNFSFYVGEVTINSSDDPPVMKVKEGTQFLIGSIALPPALTPTILIGEDEVTLKNLAPRSTWLYDTLKGTEGMILGYKAYELYKTIKSNPDFKNEAKIKKTMKVKVEDTVLSQIGDSSSEITLLFGDLFKLKYLDEIEISIDFLSGEFSGGGKLKVPALEGWGFKLGFKDRGSLARSLFPNTASVSIPVDKLGVFLPPILKDDKSLKFGALLDVLSLELRNMFSDRSLQIIGGAEFKLSDNREILKRIEEGVLGGDAVLSGQVALLIDVLKKVELSGNLELLGHFDLANAKVGIEWAKSPQYSSSVQANLDILGILKGELKATTTAAQGLVEMAGKVKGTVGIPPNFNFVGKLKGLSIDAEANANLRFSDKGKHQSKFSVVVKKGFVTFVVSLDVSNLPKIYVTVGGFDELSGWRENWSTVIHDSRSTRNSRDKKNILPLNANYETVLVVVTSEQGAPFFDLTSPDGTVHTPDNTPTAEESSEVGNIFFSRNEAAHEAYYAIKQPITGDYAIRSYALTKVYECELTSSNFSEFSRMNFAMTSKKSFLDIS